MMLTTKQTDLFRQEKESEPQRDLHSEAAARDLADYHRYCLTRQGHDHTKVTCWVPCIPSDVKANGDCRECCPLNLTPEQHAIAAARPHGVAFQFIGGVDDIMHEAYEDLVFDEPALCVNPRPCFCPICVDYTLMVSQGEYSMPSAPVCTCARVDCFQTPCLNLPF